MLNHNEPTGTRPSDRAQSLTAPSVRAAPATPRDPHSPPVVSPRLHDSPRPNPRRRLRDLALALTLLFTLGVIGGGLALWKRDAIANTNAAAANQPEPIETVDIVAVQAREYRPHTTSIGTVRALRSITLSNELPGTVQEVQLTPGAIVEAGEVLVAFDVSVEEAELRAYEAEAVLAGATLARMQRLVQNRAAPEADLERALAERNVARAQIARARALIDRKTIRSPFRARVGLADVHPGQFLESGTLLTTLQGIDEAVHVDFAVSQQVAATLRVGDQVDVVAGANGSSAIPAEIIATDSRIDAHTRNALVRARLVDAMKAPTPGASVRVRVPTGPSRPAAAIPANALRKGPGGDHVFVIGPDENGRQRAQLRTVKSGRLVGDEVLIFSGLNPGEQVASTGSFKLHENMLVTAAPTRPELVAIAK